MRKIHNPKKILVEEDALTTTRPQRLKNIGLLRPPGKTTVKKKIVKKTLASFLKDYDKAWRNF